MANNNDKKVLNVPALRFPEFTEEWKKIRLGDNCNIQMCKRIMAAQTNTEGGVPFYKIGTIGGKADAYISKDLFDEYKRKYSYPNKGEVMITCAGTVGKCVIYDGEDSYYQDSNIVWIDNPNEIISNDFLYHLLSNINWSYLNSTTIVRIYNDDLRNLKLCCPRLDEQKKIANFLSLIDERIAAQNKIIEDLKKLKSAIVEMILCKQGGVLLKLGDVGSFIRGLTYSSEDIAEDINATTVIRANNLNYGNNVSKKDVVYVNKKPTEIQILRKGDIVICMANGSSSLVGKNSYYSFDDRQSTIGAFCGIYRSSQPLVKWLMQSQRYRRLVYQSLQGGNGAIANLNGDDILNMTFYVVEDKKSVSILSALVLIENSIAVNEKLQELYSMQKEYLLQHLFI